MAVIGACSAKGFGFWLFELYYPQLNQLDAAKAKHTVVRHFKMKNDKKILDLYVNYALEL